jgi:hypothetical protein
MDGDQARRVAFETVEAGIHRSSLTSSRYYVGCPACARRISVLWSAMSDRRGLGIALYDALRVHLEEACVADA